MTRFDKELAAGRRMFEPCARRRARWPPQGGAAGCLYERDGGRGERSGVVNPVIHDERNRGSGRGLPVAAGRGGDAAALSLPDYAQNVKGEAIELKGR